MMIGIGKKILMEQPICQAPDNLVNNKEVKGSSIDHPTNLAALKLLLAAVEKKISKP